MVQTPDGPVPAEQAGQMLSQMQHAVQQMQQALQEAQSGVDREKIKAQAAIEVARINAEAKGDAEELKGLIAMLLQKLQPPPPLAADVAGDLAEDDNSRPGAGPASEYGAQGDGLPMGSNTGPEIAQ